MWSCTYCILIYFYVFTFSICNSFLILLHWCQVWLCLNEPWIIPHKSGESSWVGKGIKMIIRCDKLKLTCYLLFMSHQIWTLEIQMSHYQQLLKSCSRDHPAFKRTERSWYDCKVASLDSSDLIWCWSMSLSNCHCICTLTILFLLKHFLTLSWNF